MITHKLELSNCQSGTFSKQTSGMKQSLVQDYLQFLNSASKASERKELHTYLNFVKNLPNLLKALMIYRILVFQQNSVFIGQDHDEKGRDSSFLLVDIRNNICSCKGQNPYLSYSVAVWCVDCTWI
ncbi:hypothetical protein QVD17_37801 [Tagetes erecta]|uniref:Uncharacterized protein n=1 Tax=Tagetes erecta TaxID=13708 RepID=A0AAD8JX12_TARER|nr:hypothetical protein QVD17_37801 [Tagetes erecta]